MTNNHRAHKGITGIEYLVLIAVIIGAALMFLGPLSPFQTAYDEVLSSTSSGMMNMADQIALSMWDGQEVLTVAGVEEIADNSYIGGGGGGGEGSSSGSGGGGGGFGGGSGGGGGGWNISDGSGASGNVNTDNTGGGGDNIDDGSGGSTSGEDATPPPDQEIDTDIQTAINSLNGTTTGQYFYDLIINKKISVIYDNFIKYGHENALGLWRGPQYNTIYINELLKDLVVAQAIGAIIVHEATHADYTYNPEKVIAETLARHAELVRDDLNIIRDIE
ncbi:MAG: hypothetical protein A3C36_02745, partial [Omnitrophica WOR_2 bacterium RIFCSPHIGHO2_02_FULL_52_10]